jgi:HEAT repeat protein
MARLVSSSVVVESARKVCARFHQSYRDHRLYPTGHPASNNTRELLATTVKSHLDSLGPLTLQVTEDRLLVEGEEVYTYTESRDNLAFLMFRDGVRSLTLTPGVDSNELEALVDCLARADQLQSTDHDLTTALWENDLVHIRLEVVDPFLEGEGTADETFDELRDTVLRRLNELGSVDKAEAEAKSTPAQDTDPTLEGRGITREEQPRVDEESLALTAEEIARGEWLASHPADPLDEFVVVLLEIVGTQATLPGGEDAVYHSLSLVLGHYLESLSQDGLNMVLGQLSTIEAEGRIARGTVERTFSEAATAERLTKMIEAAAAVSPDALASVERFLAQVRASIYPALLETLSASNDKVVRKAVLDLLYMEGGTPARHLWPLMKDSRWYVVRNAVQLATTSGDPAVVGHLEPLLRHPDTRVRREVARSLATLGDPKCLPLLVRAILDDDSAVRTLAVRGLARHGNTVQYQAVQAQVESRDFESRSPEEVEAFLVAYAALGGERTIEPLNRIWKRKVFGTRPLPSRLAAVAALGAVGGAEARRTLTEAMKSGEPQIQRAAVRALGEAQLREKGGGS